MGISELTQPLDWIARSDEAVFAMDMADRIVVWNGHCERLLGRPAASVLGRRCADVMCGRDVHGNVYCVQNCPVALQARELPDEPVNAFRLSVPMPNQAHRWVRVSVFHIASPRPGLSTLVHVLNDPEAPLSLLEVRLAEEARRRAGSNGGRPREEVAMAATLTARERDILRCLAEAMPTSGIAERLGISSVTVRNHTQRILQKLGVHSKLHAVVHAYRHQLI